MNWVPLLAMLGLLFLALGFVLNNPSAKGASMIVSCLAFLVAVILLVPGVS